MSTFLEILKYILPALVVFVTVYYLMKQYLDQQYKLSSLQMRKDQFDTTLPLKLQAYERLAMFCERISVDNLSYRLSNKGANAADLSRAMLITIQQEWEHNLSQQIYVSKNLWEIITLGKSHMQEFITEAALEVGSDASPAVLMTKIMSLQASKKINALQSSKKAIREEIQLIF